MKDREIHIYLASLTSTHGLKKAYETLSTYEKNTACAYNFPQLRERYIISHAILREVLATYLEITPEEVKYQYSNHGKPSLSEELLKANTLFFNMSHSEDFALYAFSKQPVGVDIEKIKPLLHADEMEDYVFNKKEKNTLKHSNPLERLAIFYSTWVRKEAVLKCIGTGLSIALDRVETTTLYPQQTSQVIQVRGLKDKSMASWIVIDLALNVNYASAVATQVADTEISIVTARNFKFLRVSQKLRVFVNGFPKII